ncbi:MAG: hypothetical protein N3B16_06145 [Candidatus Aminicenantes bacterium]|nr:hypothetical protein [Candidatus Aminicenantes bacterium]
MREKIDEVRVPIEDIKVRHSHLYEELKTRGVVATITLYSKRANAQVFEYLINSRPFYRCVYGSSALFERWRETKRQSS